MVSIDPKTSGLFADPNGVRVSASSFLMSGKAALRRKGFVVLSGTVEEMVAAYLPGDTLLLSPELYAGLIAATK